MHSPPDGWLQSSGKATGIMLLPCNRSVLVRRAAKVLLVSPSLSNTDTGNLLLSSDAKLNDSSLSY